MEEQIRLFEIIKAAIPNNLRLADVVEEVLGVSTDAAYRRIRGEKLLTFAELVKMCRHFNVSVDKVIHQKTEQGALFGYTTIDITDQAGYRQYVKGILNLMTRMQASPEKELLFTALDIPFYHLLKFPELTFFKLYCWDDTVNRTRITYEDFREKLDREPLVKLYEQITNVYSVIPAKEIWTHQTIDTIIRLLEYHFETGGFSGKNTALLLLQQLSQLMDNVQQNTETGFKGEKHTPFALYLSPVDLENNFILMRMGGRMSCIIKL